MDKKEAEQLTNDVLMADAIIRIKALETLLISKGVFTEQEFKSQMKEVTDILTMTVLQKSNVQGDLNKIMEGLSKT